MDIDLERAVFEVDGLGEVTLPVTGLYNVANALASISVARILGLPASAIRDGLALTAHFLENHVLAPHNTGLPAARLRFADRMARASTSGGIVGQ